MRRVQIIGLLLWRGGVLFLGGTAIYYSMRYILMFFTFPLQVEVGLALILTGIGFVLASVIIERVQDVRKDRELSR